MIVDTSAVIAILGGEDDRDDFLDALTSSPRTRMAAATYLETAVVVDNLGDPVLSRRLDELLDTLGVEVVDTTPGHALIARHAYRDFGKGTGHPAQLNFGDCFSYALAKEAREPLLYKGEDFGHTDVQPAT